MKIRNLTPHPLNLMSQDGSTVTVAPDPDIVPPRVDTVEAPAGTVHVDGVTVPVKVVGTVGLPEGALPPEEEGTYLVVGKIVADAAPERRDLLTPHQLVREEPGEQCAHCGHRPQGQVSGCSALGQTPAPVAATVD